MGIDYGKKRVGIALSDPNRSVAFPHTVLKNGPQLLERVLALVADRGVEGIVVGESRTLAGVANPIQEDIEAFVSELARRTDVTIEFEPEFYTSQQVERDFGKNAMLDASAAALILQSFLDKREGWN